MRNPYHQPGDFYRTDPDFQRALYPAMEAAAAGREAAHMAFAKDTPEHLRMDIMSMAEAALGDAAGLLAHIYEQEQSFRLGMGQHDEVHLLSGASLELLHTHASKIYGLRGNLLVLKSGMLDPTKTDEIEDARRLAQRQYTYSWASARESGNPDVQIEASMNALIGSVVAYDAENKQRWRENAERLSPAVRIFGWNVIAQLPQERVQKIADLDRISRDHDQSLGFLLESFTLEV